MWASGLAWRNYCRSRTDQKSRCGQKCSSLEKLLEKLVILFINTDKTFGTPLDLLDEYYGVNSTFGMGLSALKIPIIVQECIATLKRSGIGSLTVDLSIEGIFRKNGNIRRLKEQCEKIDNDPRHINLAEDNAIQIAALLKKFLRDLPEPLLTNNLYDLFMCVISNNFVNI